MCVCYMYIYIYTYACLCGQSLKLLRMWRPNVCAFVAKDFPNAKHDVRRKKRHAKFERFIFSLFFSAELWENKEWNHFQLWMICFWICVCACVCTFFNSFPSIFFLLCWQCKGFTRISHSGIFLHLKRTPLSLSIIPIVHIFAILRLILKLCIYQPEKEQPPSKSLPANV